MLIDIHSHLAWDIDDGMDSEEHAIMSLENAKKDGIQKIIATPHFIPGKHTYSDMERMNKRITALAKHGRTYGIDIYKGCELFLNREYMDAIEQNLFLSLNGTTYVLVEFDVRKDINNDDTADDILYELKIRNYVPVIAHVERYFHKELDLDRIRNWIANGYVIQVNRTSLVGIHGSRNEKNAKLLLKHGYVHVVASDTHELQGRRICKLSDAYNLVKDRYSKENADLLFKENPSHILQDEMVRPMKVKQSLFERMFRKGV